MKRYPNPKRANCGDCVELTCTPSELPVLGVGRPRRHILPYWKSEQEAQRDIARLLRLCTTLRDTFGLRVFDPQLDSELVPERDREEMLAAFGYGTRITRQATSAARPWRKFWG